MNKQRQTIGSRHVEKTRSSAVEQTQSIQEASAVNHPARTRPGLHCLPPPLDRLLQRVQGGGGHVGGALVVTGSVHMALALQRGLESEQKRAERCRNGEVLLRDIDVIRGLWIC